MNRKLLAPTFVLTLPLWAACTGDSTTHQIDDARKATSAPMRLGVSAAERFGYKGGADPAAQPGKTFSYAIPAGWSEKPLQQFRDVNLAAPGDVSCWVTKLSGDGMGALANVNRWRGQMGLEPATAADITNLPAFELIGRDGLRVDLQKPDGSERMIGLLTIGTDVSVFVRMRGTVEAVEAQLGALDQFAQSLQMGGRADPPTGDREGGHEGERGSADGLRWQAPAAWTRLPDKLMRLCSYEIDGGAECWISILGSDGGGLENNVNRWRNEFKQAPLAPGELANLERIDVLGRKSVLVRLRGEYTGMRAAAKGGHAMLGVACMLGTRSVFVKLVGPEATVTSNESIFLEFCRSLEGS